MRVWQLQEAKAKLTELIKVAKHSPQIISRHGVKETVVMSIEEYERLKNPTQNIVEFFRSSPLNGVDLDLTRDDSQGRDIDL